MKSGLAQTNAASSGFPMRCHFVGCGANESPMRFGQKFRSRSHRAVIRVYNEAGNVIETRAKRLFHVTHGGQDPCALRTM